MILTRVTADGFRNLKSVGLSPAPGINLVTGANGAGKSTLLEALHCLSVGHSFRTRRPRELIAHDATEFLLTCEMQDPATERSHRSGLVRRNDGSVDLKFDFEPLKSFQSVTAQLPVKAVTPESHGLVQDGPAVRRQFIDWGVFHVEPAFIATWREFRRALSQRNMALRLQKSDAEIASWDDILVTTSTRIDAWRNAYVVDLTEVARQVVDRLNLPLTLALVHRPGWAEDVDFKAALASSLEHSRRMKTTTVGPHRSELSIRSDGRTARAVLSRGQQKSLVYALELAQLQLLSEKTEKRAIVLCDDLQAELDADYLASLVAELHGVSLQMFISSTDATALAHQADAVFHVEHGRVLSV